MASVATQRGDEYGSYLPGGRYVLVFEGGDPRSPCLSSLSLTGCSVWPCWALPLAPRSTSRSPPSHLGDGSCVEAQLEWRRAQLRSLPCVLFSLVMVVVVLPLVTVMVTVVAVGMTMAPTGAWLRAQPWNHMAWIQTRALPLLLG